jgi:adenylate kinase family enzyme
MATKAYIFIGQSGSGKGTQAALLDQSIRAMHPTASLLHFETGNIFRSFIQTDSYTAHKTKEAMDQGVLPASFIGVHVWSHELINAFNGQEYVIIDGTPRVAEEVPILLSAARFYGWDTTIVYIEVSDAWANDRLLGRGRADDVVELERVARLKWFHDNVMPAVELLRASTDATFVTINGERSIEEIHTDIVASTTQ